ncbi:hypothetical protein [Kitasatospora sp. NPDC018619]
MDDAAPVRGLQRLQHLEGQGRASGRAPRRSRTALSGWPSISSMTR